MSFTFHINPYKPVPEKITVPIDQMEQVLNAFPETYAVMWSAGKVHTVREQTDSEIVSLNAEGNPVKKRKRTVLYLWYKTYYYHRRGEKEQSKHPRGGKPGVTRFVQNISKKINCQAIMKVTCFKSDPSEAPMMSSNKAFEYVASS